MTPKITLLWSEYSKDKDVEFQTFEDLQEWFIETYYDWLSSETQGYYKNMIQIEHDGCTKQFRADVSDIEGDFNPLCEHIKDEMFFFLIEEFQIDPNECK